VVPELQPEDPRQMGPCRIAPPTADATRVRCPLDLKHPKYRNVEPPI
jgi:hypothetical protein